MGAHAKHLRNLYVYFWRWAAWKVFGPSPTTPDRAGIVCFITVAGFLNGPGFQRMRDDLRRSCDAIWVIDCSPEGHQPEVATRIFQDVQQPVCIVLAARTRRNDPASPARVHYRALPEGRREEKFAALFEIRLNDGGWTLASDGWREPFLSVAQAEWARYCFLDQIFDYNGSGVQPARTWIIAPDVFSLENRWNVLVAEQNLTKKELLFHPHYRDGKLGDRYLDKVNKVGLARQEYRGISVGKDRDTVVRPIRYAFRALDRQWIIPDNRLINQPNPTLWAMYSSSQIYLTALVRSSPSNGPAVAICAEIPDYDHYKGSFGGRVFPLWADATPTRSNFAPGLLDSFARVMGIEAAPEDLFAYIAAITAHPAYTSRFSADLTTPGLRIPLTADAALLAEGAALGREVVWLHTYGERFSDPAAGRPHGAPRLPKLDAPTIPKAGAIPGDPSRFPDSLTYDASKRRLHVGEGYVDNVPPAVWAYEVSGKNVLRQWFSYRRKNRERPLIGDRRPPSPLSQIQPAHWLAEYTTDLIDLLNVLGRLVLLEPRQADLLERICAGPLIDAEAVAAARPPAQPHQRGSRRRAVKPTDQYELPSEAPAT